VLLSAEDLGTNAIMRETGKSKTCVWRWQERFAAEGVDGLLRDKTRPSRIGRSASPDLGLLAQRRREFVRRSDQAPSQTRHLPIRRRPPRRHQPQCPIEAHPLGRGSRQNHGCRQTRASSVRFDPLAFGRGAGCPWPRHPLDAFDEAIFREGIVRVCLGVKGTRFCGPVQCAQRAGGQQNSRPFAAAPRSSLSNLLFIIIKGLGYAMLMRPCHGLNDDPCRR
jgi:leucine-zipper of insertion element IS481